jgi:mevalonate pyrophosphate decarboxylase
MECIRTTAGRNGPMIQLLHYGFGKGKIGKVKEEDSLDMYQAIFSSLSPLIMFVTTMIVIVASNSTLRDKPKRKE